MYRAAILLQRRIDHVLPALPLFTRPLNDHPSPPDLQPALGVELDGPGIDAVLLAEYSLGETLLGVAPEDGDHRLDDDGTGVHAGVGEQVAEITEAAMRGEIEFDESFRRRLATLEGLDESVLKEIAQSLPITEGADRLMRTLKKLGYKIGILSGGFTYFAGHLKERWGIDCVSANELDIVDGKLTGIVMGDIINGEKKAELLSKMAGQLGISMEQTIAVGDGANDLPMLGIAGLGVAFHAKPLVKASARHAISTLGLDSILYLLGVHDQEANG